MALPVVIRGVGAVWGAWGVGGGDWPGGGAVSRVDLIICIISTVPSRVHHQTTLVSFPPTILDLPASLTATTSVPPQLWGEAWGTAHTKASL